MTNEERIEALNKWSENIADKWIREEEYTLDSVSAMAAIKFLSRVSRRNRSLLPKDTIVKLIQKELDDLDDTSVRA